MSGGMGRGLHKWWVSSPDEELQACLDEVVSKPDLAELIPEVVEQLREELTHRAAWDAARPVTA